MPWHETGYGALFVMESNQVLFEFVLRDIVLTGMETRVEIDRRFLYVCEVGTLTVAGAPCGDQPWPVGAEVRGNELVLRAWPLLRPRKVTLKLTGVRRGFREQDMDARTREQFVKNEAFIQSAY